MKRGISPTRPRQKAMEDLKAKSAGGFWDHLMDFMGISWGFHEDFMGILRGYN